MARTNRLLSSGLATLCLAAALVAVVTLVLPAGAQPPTAGERPAASAEAEAPAPQAAPDSPRASVKEFVELSAAGEYEDAARFLDLPPSRKADGAALARKLKSVLDRHGPGGTALAELASPLSSGNLADKLPPGVDRLLEVPGPRGPEPVRLMRRGTNWVFSRATVDRISVWYASLEERWLFDSLPEPLLRPGPFDILYWQYAAMIVTVALAWVTGRLLGFVTRKVAGRVAARPAAWWNDALLGRLGPPLTLAWGLGAFAIAVHWLDLYESARPAVYTAVRAGRLIAAFWAAWRSVDVAKRYVLEKTEAKRSAARSVVPLAVQLAKILVLCVAVVMILSELGYPVASLIAGLGIGGIALALAAQKTGENLFGSLSIGVDQPFRVGDFVRVEDLVGTVEAVGLRSTRIRTLDRTLVTMPNGKLADMRIENFTARDRFRLNVRLGLVYGTTAEQLEAIVRDIEAAMREEPSFFKQACMVVVAGFGASSIDIEVMGWFETKDWDEFVIVRQRVLLRFMAVIEKNGSEFAFPTQTLHMIGARDRPGRELAS
jgi:MscS family membrane protein